MDKKKQLLEALNWRYAVKRFDSSKKLDEDTLHTLLEAVRLTPSSLGMQPWKLKVIESREYKEQLKEAGFNQTQWTDASHIVVICAKNIITSGDVERYLQSVVSTRDVTRESLDGFAKNIYNFLKMIKISNIFGRNIMRLLSGMSATDWAEKQCYIALGNLLTSAAVIGVDACPMEGFIPTKFDKILGLKEYHSVVTCALGYRDVNNDFLATSKKVRYSFDEVVKIYK